jgi:catechol 2,3-dioxygenase-like lactoylglutathione lyase family enzyme
MTPPRFNQVNLIVGDVDRSLDFYRAAGLNVSAAPEWPTGSGCRHAEVGDDATLEWDNEPFVRVWAPEVDTTRLGPVIGLSLGSSEEVDETFRRLVDAGHRGLQPPYDAFWGARYAIVEDPDGHAVGLMGPKTAERRFVPEV